MRILHIIFAFNIGGSESMLVDIGNHQIELAEVEIIIINNSYNQDLLNKIDSRVKVHLLNRKEGSKNPIPIIKLNILLLKISANVLHCHNHNIIPLIIAPLSRKAVLTLHCTGIPSKYLNKYKKLFSISEAVRMDVMTRCQIETQVVYNGISKELIKEKENYFPDQIFKIICVGRLAHLIKGQHIAIEALHKLREKGIRNIRMDFIGSGDSELYLKELTNNLELKERINFLGLKDRNYIYSHLKEYDLLIQPSLFEGFGLTVVEGIAAGLAVLVSDIDGPKEIIDKTGFGFSFQSGNAEDCANKIYKIYIEYRTSEFYLKIKQQQLKCKELFDIKKTSDKYINEYCTIKNKMVIIPDKNQN